MEMHLEIEGYVFLVYFYHTKRDCPAKSVSPFIMPMY